MSNRELNENHEEKASLLSHTFFTQDNIDVWDELAQLKFPQKDTYHVKFRAIHHNSNLHLMETWLQNSLEQSLRQAVREWLEKRRLEEGPGYSKDSLQESPAFHATLSYLRQLLDNGEYEDLDEDDFTVSEYAFNTTQYLLIEVYRRLGAVFPRPAVFPNGGKGILLQWNNAQRQIRLVVPGNENLIMYIYHEDGHEYDAEADVSPDSLASWLVWINRA